MFGAVAVLALFAVAYGQTTEEIFEIDVKTADCNGHELTSLKKAEAVKIYVTDVGGSDSTKCSASANAASMRVSQLSSKQSDCAAYFKDDGNFTDITTESSTEAITSKEDYSCSHDNKTYLYFDNPCDEDRKLSVKVTYTPDSKINTTCIIWDYYGPSDTEVWVVIVLIIVAVVLVLTGVVCWFYSGCPLYKRRHANKMQQKEKELESQPGGGPMV